MMKVWNTKKDLVEARATYYVILGVKGKIGKKNQKILQNITPIIWGGLVGT